MDLVTELRKLEGINTSFDYGVELVVMTVKETIGNWEDLKQAIIGTENKFQNLFTYDYVCGEGFRIAKIWIFDYIHFHLQYLDFIREFKYCEGIYAMISEELITLDVADMGEIRKQSEIELLSEDISAAGFKFEYTDKGNVVEFRVLCLVD